MSNFIFLALDKMGNWFGIIFKIILPLFAMYRPIKTFTLSFAVFGALLGGDSQMLSDIGVIAFFVLYGIFAVLLIFLPKVASATEFFLIFFYLGFWALVYFAAPHSIHFEGMTKIFLTYLKALPLVMIFLAGKIFFFYFVRKNYMSIAQIKSRSRHIVDNPEDY